jgi:hypothetical protein
MRCMSTFPDGRGMQSNASSAMGTNSATTGMIQTVVAAPSNGVPVYANMFEFKSPYPLMASQNFALSYSTLQPISFIDAGTGPLVGVTEPAGSPIIAGCILAELEGMWATPASA